MILLEAQEIHNYDDAIFNTRYELTHKENDIYTIYEIEEYKFDDVAQAGQVLQRQQLNKKRMYDIRLTEPELELARFHLEAIFKYLEIRYTRRNIWFRELRPDQVSKVVEFQYTNDLRQILLFMNALLYTDNHIIDSDDNRVKIEVFVAPIQKELEL